jgi:hypothetical protein
MKTLDVSRRRILTAGTTTALGLAAGAALAPTVARADAACGGLSRAEFMEYVQLFNANDPSFIRFYHDDVVLELGATSIKTAKGIRDFYAEVKAHIKEKVEVTHFVSDATGIAAELPTEFRVFKDWENGFFQRPLKAGEVMRTISFGLYNVQDRKFKHIKAARYKQLHDWRMES